MKKRIKSFKDKETEALFAGQEIPRWKHISKPARRKLEMLNVARQL
jgi:toxin HigB-1